MDDPLTDHDSPLSITSSVTGILTFLVAIVAAVYVRIIYLRDSDEEYFKVKTSLSWFKKESTWLRELVQATGHIDRFGPGGMSAEQYMQTAEYQMYAFVMDDLARLEQRLLDVVAETEEAAGDSASEEGEQWPLVPRSWGWTRTKTTVAMAWLPVRRKALELVRQRDALTARVLFTQMSMLTSRIRDLEHRTTLRETRSEEKLMELEEVIHTQHNQIQRLQELMLQATRVDMDDLRLSGNGA